jgi:hypothetical protein
VTHENSRRIVGSRRRLVGACTVVKIGKGDTNTIEHAAGAEKDLTSRACRKAGRSTNGLTHAPDALAGALPPIQLVLHGLIHPLHITQLRLGSTHLTLEP